MLTFERSTDTELIHSIMTAPEVWESIGDDFTGNPKDFQLQDHPSLHYIIVKDDCDVMGLWLFVERNRIEYEVHTCLLKSARGARAFAAAKLMAQWVWDNTPCLRIVTTVPRPNRAAMIFALKAGMKPYGVNEASIMIHGKLEDQTLLGMSKPGVK